MIKLIQLISELEVNNPNISVDEIYQYFSANILRSQELEYNDDFWDEYKKTGNVYRVKMNQKDNYFLNKFSFEQLSQPDRNQFYKEMKQLVQKYSKINELEVENPNKDWLRVWAMYCYLRQDYDWDELYPKIDLLKQYHRSYMSTGKGSLSSFLKTLSQQQLNKLYRELKQLDTYGK